MAREKQTTLLVLISSAFFITQLDVSIVNIALPAIQDKMNASTRQLQWVIDTYTLLLASLQLTGGKLSDKFSARSLFLIGLPLFTAASALCALAGNMSVLLAGRTIQGLAAALLLPSSLSILNTCFGKSPKKATIIANFITAGAIALAAGPLIGGLLIHSFGWQSIFWINVPIGIVISLLAVRFLPHREVITAKIDAYAQLLVLVLLFSFTFLLIELQQIKQQPLLGIVPGACCVLSLVLFIVAERKTKAPFIPWHLFKKRAFVSPLATGFIINFSFYSLVFILSLFFQSYLKYSTRETGFIFLPLMAMVIVSNQLAGRLSKRYDAVSLIKVGLLIGLAGLAGIIASTWQQHLVYFLIAELVTSLGLALVVPLITHLFLNNIPADISGIGSGILNTFRQIGGAIGVALTGTILSLPLAAVVTYRLALGLCCGALVLGASIRYKV